MTAITENDVEQAALAWLKNLGWQAVHGPDITPETPKAEYEELAARGKSPVEGAAGFCGRSARSEEDGDPGDLLRRTTKPTTANVRRPKGYAPLPAGCAESAALCSWSGHTLRNRPQGA